MAKLFLNKYLWKYSEIKHFHVCHENIGAESMMGHLLSHTLNHVTPFL